MLNSINRISKVNTSYTPANPCKIYIKGKFAASPNHNVAITYYSKYNSYITSDLYNLISKTVFYGIKYLYTLLNTATKYLNF